MAEPRWVSVQSAARFLDLKPGALRRALERRAVRGDDGDVEARFDGIHARKLGRLWRIRFSEAWLEEP